MTDSAAWGNPASTTFRKKYIRRVVAQGCTVFVHAEIADIVAEILNSALASGVELPEQLQGYVPLDEGDLGPQTYGAAFTYVDGMMYEPWKFELEGDVLVFKGTIEEAKHLSELAESSRMLRIAENETTTSDAPWQHCRPGQRSIHLGDRGDDVVFLQELFGSPDTDGIYGHAVQQQVKQVQRNAGLEPTGSVDDSFWRVVLPRHSKTVSLSRGDAGKPVRVLQALLVAYDWNNDLRVTGIFDMPTDKTIRHIQETVGLRVSGRVRSPEWAYLLGKTVDS